MSKEEALEIALKHMELARTASMPGYSGDILEARQLFLNIAELYIRYAEAL